MNYNSLVFRKNTYDSDSFFNCIRSISALHDAYLDFSNRVVVKGIKMIPYEGKLFAEDDVKKSFAELVHRYDINVDRGYDVGDVKVDNEVYYLGSSEVNKQNPEVNSFDFSSHRSSDVKECFPMSGGRIIIEVYENGSIVRDIQTDSTYYYSNRDTNFLRTFKDFQLDIDTVASFSAGRLKKHEKYDIIDGLSSNRLRSNLCKALPYQVVLNSYRKGYRIDGVDGNGRNIFMPEIKIKGKDLGHVGRVCDNEPEAICEAYKIETTLYNKDSDYLFNPINYHRNHRYLIDRFVRGELTESELTYKVLSDVAKNPFLVLRYNLIGVCNKMNISIAPFCLDDEGYMINMSGTRYSDIAQKYIDGKLSTEDIDIQPFL